MQYRGQILPLVRLDRHLLGAYGETDAASAARVVVYTDGGRSVGSSSTRSSTSSRTRPRIRSDIDDRGLLGSAVIGDKVTELLDVRAGDPRRRPDFYDRRRAVRRARPTPASLMTT